MLSKSEIGLLKQLFPEDFEIILSEYVNNAPILKIIKKLIEHFKEWLPAPGADGLYLLKREDRLKIVEVVGDQVVDTDTGVVSKLKYRKGMWLGPI